MIVQERLKNEELIFESTSVEEQISILLRKMVVMVVVWNVFWKESTN